jgi:hypothetical protein
MKPPVPNVSGLIYFIQDVSKQFTIEEQSSISMSDAGRQIQQSYYKCMGHSKQLQDTRIKLKHYMQQTTTTKPNNISATDIAINDNEINI